MFDHKQKRKLKKIHIKKANMMNWMASNISYVINCKNFLELYQLTSEKWNINLDHYWKASISQGQYIWAVGHNNVELYVHFKTHFTEDKQLTRNQDNQHNYQKEPLVQCCLSDFLFPGLKHVIEWINDHTSPEKKKRKKTIHHLWSNAVEYTQSCNISSG